MRLATSTHISLPLIEILLPLDVALLLGAIVALEAASCPSEYSVVVVVDVPEAAADIELVEVVIPKSTKLDGLGHPLFSRSDIITLLY